MLHVHYALKMFVVKKMCPSTLENGSAPFELAQTQLEIDTLSN